MAKEKLDKDLLIEEDKEFFPSAKRDMYYSALVKDIVKDNRSSQTMKCWFFVFVCGIFLFTCIAGMLTILNISKKENVSAADIGVAITAFGTVLSSIIVLPQTIAKHLFPANSEQARFAFIKDNQQFDSAYVLNNGNSTSEDDESIDEDEDDDDEEADGDEDEEDEGTGDIEEAQQETSD